MPSAEFIPDVKSVITSVEKQKKDADRYNVFINNEFAFGIYSDSLVKFGLRKGDILDETLIEKIKSYDEINFGKKVSIKYLAYKPRSTSSVIKKLRTFQLSQNSIDEVINWLKSLNYLNDEVFVKQLIESKIQGKPIGKRLLKYKISETGIEKSLIEENVENLYTEDVEFENAKKLLKKYIPKIKKGNDFEKKKKCFQYLISRGFNLTLANTVLKEFFEK